MEFFGWWQVYAAGDGEEEEEEGHGGGEAECECGVQGNIIAQIEPRLDVEIELRRRSECLV